MKVKMIEGRYFIPMLVYNYAVVEAWFNVAYPALDFHEVLWHGSYGRLFEEQNLVTLTAEDNPECVAEHYLQEFLDYMRVESMTLLFDD
jgi:hypothetical protein